jgi:CubicO group peptidase (beta-lactamase class C family)
MAKGIGAALALLATVSVALAAAGGAQPPGGRPATAASVAAGGAPVMAGVAGEAAAGGPRAALQRVVPGLLARYHVPGLAVSVLRGRRLAFTACFGVRRAGAADPVTADTVFEAASLSKPPVAYEAMREVAGWALVLDKPLAGYLAKPYLNDAQGAGITARRVLSHSSGLPNWARGRPLAVEFPPGSRWQYSGEGYVYLQRVLEKVTGQPLAELMRHRVLEPLGMKASSYVWRDEYERSYASPHDAAGTPGVKERPLQANAASSLHTTAPEYAALLAAMLDPAAHADLLPPAAVGTMLAPQIQVDARLGLWWGLGWGLEKWEGRLTFFHWGANDGFRSFALGDPVTGDGLVVFTNGAAGLELMDEVVRAVDGRAHPLFGFRMLHPQD